MDPFPITLKWFRDKDKYMRTRDGRFRAACLKDKRKNSLLWELTDGKTKKKYTAANILEIMRIAEQCSSAEQEMKT